MFQLRQGLMGTAMGSTYGQDFQMGPSDNPAAVNMNHWKSDGKGSVGMNVMGPYEDMDDWTQKNTVSMPWARAAWRRGFGG